MLDNFVLFVFTIIENGGTVAWIELVVDRSLHIKTIETNP